MAVLSFKAKPVTKEQFEEFNKAVHEDYHVGNPTDTSGTIQDHSSTVDYKYDKDKQEVLFNIEKVHRGFFEKVDPEQVKNQLMNFLNDVTSGDDIEAVDPEDEENPEEHQTNDLVTSDNLPSKNFKVETTGGQQVTEPNPEFKAPEPISPTGENFPVTQDKPGEPVEPTTGANTPEPTNSNPEVKPFTPKVNTSTSNDNPAA